MSHLNKHELFKQLDDTLADGHDINIYTPDELCCDLIAYSASYDGSDVVFDPNNDDSVIQLRAACKEWLEQQ